MNQVELKNLILNSHYMIPDTLVYKFSEKGPPLCFYESVDEDVIFYDNPSSKVLKAPLRQLGPRLGFSRGVTIFMSYMYMVFMFESECKE